MNTLFIYLLVILTTTLVLYGRNVSKLRTFIAAFYLSLIFGLRIGIGNDYENYVNMFYAINVYDTGQLVTEPFFFLLNKLGFILFGNDGYHFVLFFCSFLQMIFLLLAFRNFKCESFFGLCLFLSGIVFFLNNGVRQGVSISIFIYSLTLLNVKSKKYFLTNLFGFIFHYSSLLFFVFPFIPWLNKSRNYFFYLAVWFISFALYQTNFIGVFFQKAVSFIPYYGDIYLERIVNYKLDDSGSGLVVIFWYFIMLYIILYKEKLEPRLLNISVLGGLLYLAGVNFEMWERVFIPFFSVNFLVLSIIFKRSLLQDKYNFFAGIFIVLMLFSLFSYQVIWDKNKNKASPFNHMLYNESTI
ncbi:EpsG family protein [Aeromonas veronii]|uniref:EpsG family protein n=1 Tax=Aeromonas veronii TaxID=654 RepID=UPI003D1C2E8B